MTASRLTDDDLHLFAEGTHGGMHEKLGSHPTTVDGLAGCQFAVWAPSAARVSVIGDWNGWSHDSDALQPRGDSGIWEGFVAHANLGALYKYAIVSKEAGYEVEKADPYARRQETPSKTGSIISQPRFDWTDDEWMNTRGAKQRLDAPISIYEVHLGSFRRVPEEGDRSLTYREAAHAIAEHVTRLGFTHVELLPVMEHPFYGSWGYQTTGYFAPTGRYGTPEDFMYFVDHLHSRGIGVILDWVPSHFPCDEHALGFFDGTHLYEHADPRQGFHPDWSSYIFNYGRPEVVSFLISSALYWLEYFHADGIRVDAVASMLYLDYSRKDGEWIPNRHGGRENLEAIDFIRRLNSEIYRRFPDVQTFAEESTSWPKVSHPTTEGGLGFGLKWDMGWMNDTLSYMAEDPVHRRHHHQRLTFRGMYAFSENFMLPLSHDEVVHGKGTLLGKMPGDDWQKRANLRLLFAYMFAQAGKKLLFMGNELGQWNEWDHESSLDWHLLEEPGHAGIDSLVGDLNRLYRSAPALHSLDCDARGFEWIDAEAAEQSVLSLLRLGAGGEAMIAVMNFTPVPHHGYRIGAPLGGAWSELLNTDAEKYGGSGVGNDEPVTALDEGLHGRPFSLSLSLPPLGALFLVPVEKS